MGHCSPSIPLNSFYLCSSVRKLSTVHCAQHTLIETLYSTHFPHSFSLNYGGVLQDPKDEAILKMLHDFNFEWLNRLNIAIVELAQTVRENISLLRQCGETIFIPEFLDGESDLEGCIFDGRNAARLFLMLSVHLLTKRRRPVSGGSLWDDSNQDDENDTT